DHQAARIVDFGRAREAPRAGDPEAVRASHFGQTPGTLAYIAPEARRRRFDARMHLLSFPVPHCYPLSCLLHFHPEAGGWRLAHHDDFFGADAIPRAIGDILRRAMSHDRGQRQGSLRELLDALRARRDRVEPPTVSGVVQSILSPIESGIRRIVG